MKTPGSKPMTGTPYHGLNGKAPVLRFWCFKGGPLRFRSRKLPQVHCRLEVLFLTAALHRRYRRAWHGGPLERPQGVVSFFPPGPLVKTGGLSVTSSASCCLPSFELEMGRDVRATSKSSKMSIGCMALCFPPLLPTCLGCLVLTHIASFHPLVTFSWTCVCDVASFQQTLISSSLFFNCEHRPNNDF